MKKIFKSLLFCFLAILIIASCKKNEFSDLGEGNVEAKEYIFNRATNTFETGNEVTSNISTTSGVKFVYSYLVRTGKPNLLVKVTDNSKSPTNDLALSISVDSLNKHDLATVTGLKIMVKLVNNSSLEGFIPIKYFDPALPQFTAFPSVINANVNGSITAIAGVIKSEFGIKQVDILDDYQTENTYVLVNSITDIAKVKEYALNYAYTYRKAAQHIKIRAIDIYNQASEIVINMPVDVSFFKPRLQNFPASVATTATSVSGLITSITGLKKVDIYDDRNGAYQLLNTVDNLNGVKTYNYNSSYSFKKRASNIKIIAIDTEDLQTELIIPINITYQSLVYRDVDMNAQNLGTKTAFLSTGAVTGNCGLLENEANLYFLFAQQTAGATFFNPSTAATGSITSSLKCNGANWAPISPSNLNDTKFRVLVDGASTGQTAIYNLLADGAIDDLSDAFFTANAIGAPTSNNPRYDGTTAAAAGFFNTTNGRLIYAKVRNPTTQATKNVLIHIKEIKLDGGNSTTKFDIYIQK